MSAVLSVREGPSPWPLALGSVMGAMALVIGLYYSTFASMVAIWSNSATFTHAYLVVPISLWLVWQRRQVLRAIAPLPQPMWLLPMAAAGLLWLLGDLAGVNAVVQFAATAMLVLTVPAVLGTDVARAILFPLAFLFFMVPVGDFALPKMMEWTADFTVAALRVVGVPVYREGLQFMIPSGTWSVVEACSGVRFLIASFMVGTLFGYLNYRSNTRRWIFAGVAILVPIVANWLRAFMIVMLGHLSSNKLAVGVDHLIYGWIFFGIIIMIMFTIGARWSEPEDADRVGALGPMNSVSSPPVASAMWGVALALAVMVVGTPRLVSAALHAPGPALVALELPALADTFDARVGGDYAPVFEQATAQTQRSYGFEGALVTVHVAYFRDQTYGRKVGSSQNMLVKAEDPLWQIASAGYADVVLDGQMVSLRTAELRAGTVSNAGSAQRRVYVRQIYWVDGRLTASPTRATLYAVAAQLMGRGDDAAALTVHLTAADGAAAQRTLDAFMRAHLSALSQFLAATRARR